MNVSLTNVDSVNAILQINVAKADYQEKVDNSLKNFRKKANIPGFRPGTVPMGMVKKMYGKSILAEEINKLVGESLYNYIQENKLNVLGEPLPNEEKQQAIDFATEGDYEFFFDIALAPEIKLSLTKKDKIPYYKIDVNQELVDKQIESYKANYGKYDKVEEGAKETDLIRGVIKELEDGKVKENGINVESGVVMPSYMKDAEEQAKFVGTKAGDVVKFNPGKAYEGNETEIASLLHIDKNAVEAIAPEFNFEVTEITRYKEAELDQDLFDKVFGAGTVKDAGEFTEKVKEIISEQFAPDSDYKFLLDAKGLLEKKAGDIQFPDAFLKRWLLTTGEERTAESLDNDFPKIIEDLKFHLIKEQIAKDNNIKIENEDMKAIAMQAARAQFAQYGMMNLPDEMVENYANDMLKNKDNARNLLDRAMENKIIDVLKTKLGVEEKAISLDEFRKFFEKEEEKTEA
ncbi:trigger factor [Dysgonomonas sp. PFB1-18]|uniref:trigger factor n=1 Tax=unclassified Dysgonomonas TaxID=2630389 RepID=UPI002473DE29|nr:MULTISPECIES: trigger factor [unclassified Dysgonomonas]MDH6308259.1 trigger factor [Dysgonomonas sp. PF1-14]MDH6338302.1 trigger factor [Dysgonomonas sp. PF1-16]MDH6379799.1 trigger factor [Dysgonomonas sp. PFB1-18]MDH6397111.1 trigger factor [Dysgonomonas sp. PF1-23]